MEDEKLKTLFTDFDPELPPDTRFMSRLRRNMESVELVKQQNARAFAIIKRAVSLALLVGFIVGILSSRKIPSLTASISLSLIHNSEPTIRR
ncbi:MAG: hypothetical protein K2J06_05005, partial [Muribaculaceae bacterium]|nr:hypothetical protein [Muribaculaceae bacterium]